MTWKVYLATHTPTPLSELNARYTTSEVLEIRDTHGLLSLMMVRLVKKPHRRKYLSAPSVNAIIFLAPISTFDQVLAEVRSLLPRVSYLRSIGSKDPHVNRLEDSLLLWKTIVSNKLLCNVSIILFLNKCDLLQVCACLYLSHRLAHASARLS